MPNYCLLAVIGRAFNTKYYGNITKKKLRLRTNF